MKGSLFILLFSITLCVSTYSQDTWAPIGSIWHYTQNTIDPNIIHFKTIESISDTTINGISCRKLLETEGYGNPGKTSFHYTYSKNDSIFFFNSSDNNFHLLYDFGAIKGDTIVLDGYRTNDDTFLRMIIDSVGSIQINNEERKIQYITSGDGMFIEFGEHVIEGIGCTYFMFPITDMTTNGPLRCYQDSEIGLFLNPFNDRDQWDGYDCEQIITGINETMYNENIAFYPNPTSGAIMLKNVDVPSSYRVFNAQGKLFKTGVLEGVNEINLYDLHNGIYFIELLSDNTVHVLKIVKK